MTNLSKRFKVIHGKPRTLKDRLLQQGKQQAEALWALQDINLQVPKGASLALLGKNGSGKSTLLKLMSRILRPTAGEVKVNGKISTLLELGAGFHPEFTGRENIFLNGSILGISRKEMRDKLGSIIAFSELERFIDAPIKTYSTGMYMRLGFSVAIHAQPDILLMDEILAVGDHSFQIKCIREIMRLKSEGTTIVFVSHSGEQAKKICDEAIWLEDGRIRLSGSSEVVVKAYEKNGTAHEGLAEFHYKLACRSQQQLDFTAALEHFDQALEQGYSEYSVKILRSSVYLELGRKSEASRDAIRCLDILPPGVDRESVANHVRFIGSKLETEWVKSSGTVLTSNRTALPSFLIIGTQKGGTTSLYSYLTQHPNIRPAVIKEVHYFDEQYDQGLDWYKSHFPADMGEYDITGEASPYYLFHPQVPERVHHSLAKTKFIVLLRNPVERAYSHYQMMVRRGLESLPFAEAVRAESSRGVEEELHKLEQDPAYVSSICSHYSYLKRGLYAEQLDRWFRCFPREQFLIMSTEQLMSHTAECYERAVQFLGVPEWKLQDFKLLHEGGYEMEMNEEIRRSLSEYFKPHNAALFEMIGETYDWE
jgi:ABC-type polysaccharide/polyol phosphate transport system ATPase subunit